MEVRVLSHSYYIYYLKVVEAKQKTKKKDFSVNYRVVDVVVLKTQTVM